MAYDPHLSLEFVGGPCKRGTAAEVLSPNILGLGFWAVRS